MATSENQRRESFGQYLLTLPPGSVIFPSDLIGKVDGIHNRQRLHQVKESLEIQALNAGHHFATKQEIAQQTAQKAGRKRKQTIDTLVKQYADPALSVKKIAERIARETGTQISSVTLGISLRRIGQGRDTHSPDSVARREATMKASGVRHNRRGPHSPEHNNKIGHGVKASWVKRRKPTS